MKGQGGERSILPPNRTLGWPNAYGWGGSSLPSSRALGSQERRQGTTLPSSRATMREGNKNDVVRVFLIIASKPPPRSTFPVVVLFLFKTMHIRRL